MANAKFKSVDEYLDAQPDASRAALERVRQIIRRVLSRAEEEISYGMPAYRTDAGVVIYFAGWKNHYSLYPAKEQLVRAFERELAPYEISKGTIRFPLGRGRPRQAHRAHREISPSGNRASATSFGAEETLDFLKIRPRDDRLAARR